MAHRHWPHYSNVKLGGHSSMINATAADQLKILKSQAIFERERPSVRLLSLRSSFKRRPDVDDFDNFAGMPWQDSIKFCHDH